LKFLLLDASIIIEAHKLKIWQSLVGHYEICIASSVASEASFVPNGRLMRKNYIDLRGEFKSRKLTKISLPYHRVEKIVKQTKRKMIEEIHFGEAESIAVLLLPGYEEYFFCTSDKPAVFAAYQNSVVERVVSLEMCLNNIGINKKLTYQYTEEALDKWKAEAIQRF
jgi:hypothetical protein